MFEIIWLFLLYNCEMLLFKKRAEKHDVLFYSKAGCPLCDEAREVLHGLEEKFSFDIREIDITGDSALFERYRNIIPVVIIDGKYTFGARVSEDDIISCLEGLDQGPGRSH